MEGHKLKLLDVRMYKDMKLTPLPQTLKNDLSHLIYQLDKIGLSIYRTKNGTTILNYKNWEIHHVVCDIGIKQYIYERGVLDDKI